VTNEAEDDVAEARVWLSVGDTLGDTVLTGADGRCRLEWAQAVADTECWVCVDAPAYTAGAWALSELPRESNEVRVRVRPAGRYVLAGTVVDEDGKVIPDARVEAWHRRGEDALADGRYSHRIVPQRVGTLCRDGRFSLSVGAGRWYLEARREGYAPASLSSMVVVLAEQHEGDVTLTLRRVFGLLVRALDARTGELIPAANYGQRVGPTWRPGGIPLERPWTATDGLLHAAGATQQAIRVQGSDTSVPVRLTVRAFGYRPATAEVVPKPVGDGTPTYDIALQPLDGVEFGTARLAASWANEHPFSGPLLVSLLDASGRSIELPATFVDGVCRGEVRIPAGDYHVGASAWEGSTLAWRQPVRGKRIAFRVAAGARTEARLSLQGGRLLLRPTLEGDAPTGAFTLKVRGVAQSTWMSPSGFVVERGADPGSTGTVVMLDAGPADVVIEKVGYEIARTQVVIPLDGAPVTGAPRLEPSAK
jgi:hypothetical protein